MKTAIWKLQYERLYIFIKQSSIAERKPVSIDAMRFAKEELMFEAW